ncbi:MAG: sulfotransferase domain-containing protein [Planctomycetota bacterium]|jgi:hypothetical protein
MNARLHLRRVSHHVTWFLGTRFPKAIPLVFVVAYPKSGTTWVTQLVAHYLQLPYPRNSLLPVGCPAVVHGHEPVWRSYRQGVYVVRDGRDALLSMYFYMAKRIPDGDHPRMTAHQRRMFPGLVNKANVHDNIAAYVERQLVKPQSSRVNWADHVRSYFDVNNPNVVLVRYEDLLRDGETIFAKAMSELTGKEADLEEVRYAIKRYSFQRQAKRRPGPEGAHWLRKGQSGEWMDCFTREAAEIFDRYCGDMLVATGYEPDHSWVGSCQGGPGGAGFETGAAGA